MFGEIKNRHGERLDYTFHEGKEGSKSIVVIGHGVTGNKDRPFVVALGEGLAAAGFPALRFSFSGNGASEGKFTDSTISKEVDDLGAVLAVLEAATQFATWVTAWAEQWASYVRARIIEFNYWFPSQGWCTPKPSHNANLAMSFPTKVSCGTNPTCPTLASLHG